MLQKAHELLQNHFGYSSFRLGQEQAISSVLEGENTVCVMPTGGGKSIVYQIPALVLPGTTIVISPLISLMKDQVDTLTQLGIPATYINSSLSAGEAAARMMMPGTESTSCCTSLPSGWDPGSSSMTCRTWIFH
ncbi:ATP-dependent DNA helicase [Mesobacillus boroniphilus JCM 21738]|uniref:DNA 3'-5' helicase n=1 Tax=Mesobacillus boroniphilus JCM 21738 TaxID=1294265 RepID=W4RPI6_9BACI|nr:ATP-dependent DNA helicase [Mesobacillus boroniphilus JCM 21738]